MKHLSLFARILTPAAMVAFLTIEITKSQTFAAPVIYVIAVAAFFTSIGIEAWGIMAGQNLERAWRVNRNKWATAVQLVLYVGIASYLLRTNPTLVVLPLVAALVYVSAALSDVMETAVNEQTRETAVQQSFDFEQAAADRELERRIKLETALAKIAAKSANPTPQKTQTPAPVPQAATLYECACGQVYEKAQSYSAHTRSCATHRRIAANGHVKELHP